MPSRCVVLQGSRKPSFQVPIHLTSCFPKHKQDIAQALSARLNGAYQSLLNPLSRAEYILELNQLPMSESDQVNDLAFVSHVMDARETIEDGEDESEIMTLAKENDGVCVLRKTCRDSNNIIQRGSRRQFPKSNDWLESGIGLE